MTPRQLASRARAALRKGADARVKERQQSYFKPWEKVSLYGVATPEVSGIERGLYQLVRREWRFADAVAFCDLLMRDRYIESKSLGLMLLARYHRQYPEALLRNVKGWLAGNFCDNWAVTDQLSTQIVGILIDKFPKLADTVESWDRSPNLWLRRASAVSFVKPAGKGRYLEHAYRIATVLLPDSHDLIHKACGWLLREAGKSDAARLERYLLEHGSAIPRTTVRYAIERFPESQRQLILQKTRSADARTGIQVLKG
jgi:3-methyladenine DNA glycosylase AlkD